LISNILRGGQNDLKFKKEAPCNGAWVVVGKAAICVLFFMFFK
jgi:hypothetical protein